jgi:hypothetical protein
MSDFDITSLAAKKAANAALEKSSIENVLI